MKGSIFLPLLFLAVFTWQQNASAEANEGLQRFLQRYPEADLDGDGILSREEARLFRMKLWQQDQEQGLIPSEAVEKRERRQITLSTPTYKGLSYGEKEEQAFDLWLPQGHPLPCPTLFYLSSHEADTLPAQLFRDCLDEGWASCVVYIHGSGSETVEEKPVAEEQEQDSLENVEKALRFFSEQAVSHGIRPDSIFLHAQGSLAPYALYGRLLYEELELTNLEIKGTALYLQDQEDFSEQLESAILSIKKQERPSLKTAVFHRKTLSASWLKLLDALEEDVCSLHPLPEDEKEGHMLKQLFLFFKDTLN
jgi:hypothetical protein